MWDHGKIHNLQNGVFGFGTLSILEMQWDHAASTIAHSEGDFEILGIKKTKLYSFYNIQK